MDRDLIVPLCERCHGQFDAHRLDILHVLGIDEQLALVRAAGGIEQARIRVVPSQYR